jgi:hypothetical protein
MSALKKIVLYTVLMLPVCWWLYRNAAGDRGLNLLPQPAVTFADVFCEPYTRVISVVGMGWFIFLLVRSHKRVHKLSKPQSLVPIRPHYGIPTTGVPHGRYEASENGFRIKLPHNSEDGNTFGALLLAFGVPAALILHAIYSVTTGLLVGVSLGIAVVCICFAPKPPTVIEVVGDTVRIDGYDDDIPLLELDYFKNFIVWNRDRGVVNRKYLGFQYGHQLYGFGGYWHLSEVDEIAAALNFHLNRHRDGWPLAVEHAGPVADPKPSTRRAEF